MYASLNGNYFGTIGYYKWHTHLQEVSILKIADIFELLLQQNIKSTMIEGDFSYVLSLQGCHLSW